MHLFVFLHVSWRRTVFPCNASKSRAVRSDMSPYTFTKQRNEVDLTRRASLRSLVNLIELSWNGKHVKIDTS